jgi:hypothetical protein
VGPENIQYSLYATLEKRFKHVRKIEHSDHYDEN